MVEKKKKAKKIISEDELYERARERIRKNAYKDRKGRWRFREGDGLVARKIAYNEIYSSNKEKYPLEFKHYVVYHKDKDRGNFDIENLALMPSKEHIRRVSRIRVREKQQRLNPIIRAFIGLLFIGMIILPLWILVINVYGFSELVRSAGFLIITLFALLVVLLSIATKSIN